MKYTFKKDKGFIHTNEKSENLAFKINKYLFNIRNWINLSYKFLPDENFEKSLMIIKRMIRRSCSRRRIRSRSSRSKNLQSCLTNEKRALLV